MKRSCYAYVPIFIGFCTAALLALAGCASPLQPGAASTGNITGRALFSGQSDHSGITVTAESTDGGKSLSVQRLLAGAAAGSKAIAAQATTNADGSYTLSGLAAGTYTVYASSRNSLEKAVTTSVTVVAGKSVTAADLNLTPTGQISGTATLNDAGSGNLGIVVFIAGTSFCALTADSGSYTISDVPAGTGYVLVASKQGYDSAIASVDVSVGVTNPAPDLDLTMHVDPVTTGSVYGTARLNGAPTGNTGIFVFLAGTSYITMTNDAGAYSLSGVAAPHSYTLVASKEGYVSASTSADVTVGGNFDAGTLDLAGVQVSAPQFSPSTGTYDSDQLVTISDATPGATIYYTTDGSAPTTSSTEYTSPITVAGNGSNVTITVKAIAVKAGMTNSAVSAAIYSIVYPAMAAQWAQTTSTGTYTALFQSTAVDASGNVYAAGWILGAQTYTFGVGVTATTHSGGYNVVLVKYNSYGVAQWAQTVTSGSNSMFYSLAVDGSDNVYAAGYINGTGPYTFGTGVTATGVYGGYNIVLVKYNTSGVAQWAQTITAGSSASAYNSVAVDTNGNVHAAGYIYGSGSYAFGAGIATNGSSSSANVVLVKYNSSGVAQWAKTITTGTAYSVYNSVAVDTSARVYVAGYINGSGTYTFGTGVTAAGAYISGSNIVVVKYNSSGVAQGAQTVYAGKSISLFSSVAVDGVWGIFAAGYIQGTGTYNFGGSVRAAGSSSDPNVLLVKYSNE